MQEHGVVQETSIGCERIMNCASTHRLTKVQSKETTCRERQANDKR